jgi:hypothetical protein
MHMDYFEGWLWVVELEVEWNGMKKKATLHLHLTDRDAAYD